MSVMRRKYKMSFVFLVMVCLAGGGGFLTLARSMKRDLAFMSWRSSDRLNRLVYQIAQYTQEHKELPSCEQLADPQFGERILENRFLVVYVKQLHGVNSTQIVPVRLATMNWECGEDKGLLLYAPWLLHKKRGKRTSIGVVVFRSGDAVYFKYVYLYRLPHESDFTCDNVESWGKTEKVFGEAH